MNLNIPVPLSPTYLAEGADIVKHLSPLVTPERLRRIEQVVAHRCFEVIPVLENLYDRGNVSAVMRSAEAFGYARMEIIEREGARFKAANRVAAGTDKWIECTTAHSTEKCLEKLSAEGFQILSTSLTAAQEIDDFDFTRPTAVIFGNEKDGVSEEALKLSQGSFRIPMRGFAESFNISVAAAITFHHIYEKRRGVVQPLAAKEQIKWKAIYIARTVANAEQIFQRKTQI